MSSIKLESNASGTGVFTYLHCSPDGVPFYVGKGTLRRSKKTYNRNVYYERTVQKIGKENILIGRIECSTDDIAFELERGVIKCLKRSGVKLTNLNEGGLGNFGNCIPWSKGKKFTEEHKAKLSAAKIGKSPWNKNRAWSKEEKEKLSFAAKHRKVERQRNSKGQYI
jgi:hypothetical protein